MFVNADTNEKNCRSLMKYADTVMYERQTGATLSELLASLDEVKSDTKLTEDQNQKVKNAVVYVTIEAFKEPLRPTKEEKMVIVREFPAKIYIQCISTINN